MEYGFWDVVKLLGSLAVFIFGMKMMSDGILKVSGNRLKNILNSVTKNRLFGVISGFAITSVVQSSSSSTVMLVSFVNAGLVSVRQAISVIMGANIGTTVTMWIIAFVGFKLKMVDYVAMPLIAIGVPLMFSSIRKRKALGEFFVGFSLLFQGLNMLKHAVPDLKHNQTAKEAVVDYLQSLADSGMGAILLFILIGTLLTVIVQSSSAAMGITAAMVIQGVVPFEVAAAMILGENIGTTITANLAALVGNTNAKRAAVAHFIFNVFGVVWMLCVFPLFIDLVDYINIEYFDAQASLVNPIPQGLSESEMQTVLADRGGAMKFGLAIFHTTFNIFNTFVLVWFIPQIEKIVNKMVKGKKESGLRSKFIGRSVVDTPELVVLESRKEIAELCRTAVKSFDQAKKLLDEDTPKRSKLMQKIAKNEAKTDEIEMEVSSYLVEASQSDLSPEMSNEIICLLGISSDLESIADISYQMSILMDEKGGADLKFKKKMVDGLSELTKVANSIIHVMNDNLCNEKNDESFEEVTRLYNKLIEVRDRLRNEHLRRLGKKEDKIQIGIIYRDLITHISRVAELSYYINKQYDSIQTA